MTTRPPGHPQPRPNQPGRTTLDDAIARAWAPGRTIADLMAELERLSARHHHTTDHQGPNQ